jgi:hypothetical protein
MDTYAGRLGYCKSIYGDHVSDVQAKGVAGDFLERPPCDMPAIIDARLADFADELRQRWDDWKEQPVYWADMAYQIRTGEDRVRSQDDYDRVMASTDPEEEYQMIKMSIPCDAEWALPEGAGFCDRGNKNCGYPGLNKPSYACIARVATTRPVAVGNLIQAAPSNYLAMGMCLPNDRGCKDGYFDNCEGECESCEQLDDDCADCDCPDFNINPQVRENCMKGCKPGMKPPSGSRAAVPPHGDGRHVRGADGGGRGLVRVPAVSEGRAVRRRRRADRRGLGPLRRPRRVHRPAAEGVHRAVGRELRRDRRHQRRLVRARRVHRPLQPAVQQEGDV